MGFMRLSMLEMIPALDAMCAYYTEGTFNVDMSEVVSIPFPSSCLESFLYERYRQFLYLSYRYGHCLFHSDHHSRLCDE